VKRAARATPPRTLRGGDGVLSTKVERMAHPATLGVFSQPAVITDEAAHVHPDVRIVFVECPYCDGENVLPGNGYANNHPHEIACKHCQCLFLLSESKQGLQRRSAEASDAA
jgi:transposase-like protein